MNTLEIAERLIFAAEIINRADDRVGPAPLRAQQLAYVHTAEDMRNWGHRRGERRSRDPKADACRLKREDEDAHALYRREFWDRIEVSPRIITEAEEAMNWYSLVTDDEDREALSAWVWCMADSKRRHFQDWCAEQGFSRETGRRRKNAALIAISLNLVRGSMQHSENHCSPMLHSGTEISDIRDTAEAGAGEEKSPPAWMAETGFTNVFSLGPQEFDWSSKRNERRRQRNAAKRKREAA